MLGLYAVLVGGIINVAENKVYINKIGNSVVLIPYHDSWRYLFDSLMEFSDDFMEDREQPKACSLKTIYQPFEKNANWLSIFTVLWYIKT